MRYLDCLAITGGIGSGKSTVLNLFKDAGYLVINVDSIAHSLLKSSSPYYKEYMKELDAWLGTNFSSKQEATREELRTILNITPDGFPIIAKIVKPYLEKSIEIIYDNAIKNNQKIAFEVPLLIEAKLYEYFSKILVIICDLNIKKERIQKRDPHLTEQEIENRINVQSSDEEKLKIANFVIDNSGTEEELLVNFLTTLIDIEKYNSEDKNKNFKA